MPPAWPLLGRDEELALIQGVLGRHEQGVVLAGGAGVGKTRLAAEAVAVAGSRGYRTAWAVATRAACSIPFGAFAHLLPRELPPVSGPTNLIRVVAEALVPSNGDEWSVLAVDDAHLLDEASAALVHHLALTCRAFVLVTVRTGEPALDSVVALWKDGLSERVEITALSRVETGELVEAALGSQIDGATLERLWSLTRGNPLFLREVVLGGLETGALIEVDGVWRWQEPSVRVPRLEAAVESRLGTLLPQERAGVEVVALGEALGPGMLERLVPAEVLDSLERRGLLSTDGDGRRIEVRLSHPLHGEVIRTAIPAVRSRTIRRQLADALEATGARRREDLLRLATWRLEAAPAQPQLMLAAARRAMVLADFRLGERLAQAALECGGGFEAAELVAGCLVGRGRFEDAEASFERLEPEAQIDSERAQAAVARATNLSANLGRLPSALAVLEDAETALGDRGLRQQVAAARANTLLVAGRTDEAIRAGLAILEGDDIHAGAVPWAVAAAAGGLLYLGRTVESQALISRCEVRLTGFEGTFDSLGDYRVYRFLAATFEGRLSDAQSLVAEAYGAAAEQGDRWASGIWAGCIGAAELRRGRVRTAVRWFREAVATLREADVLGFRSSFLGELAHSLALLRDTDGAVHALEEADKARLPSQRFDEGYIGLGRVWTLAAKGETSAAVALALEEAEVLDALGHRSLQAPTLHDVARLGEPARVAAPLARLAELCDGDLVPAFARHAAALAATDGDALGQLSREFEAMDMALFAAEAAAEAARAHRSTGRTGSALAASARARALIAHCQGAWTPALSGIETDLPLTRREREIATLAAHGLTNREIAERLVLSVRTVDNHLHRAYMKLDLHGRNDLASILDVAPAERDSDGIRRQT